MARASNKRAAPSAAPSYVHFVVTCCFAFMFLATQVWLENVYYLRALEQQAPKRSSIKSKNQELLASLQAFPTVKRNRPQVVWLMSFPNSGTSYTINNVRSMTQYAVGSNYGATEFNSTTRYMGGPWLEPDKPIPPTSLLTKTHCGGSCDNCGPARFFSPDEDFDVSCARGTTKNRQKLFYAKKHQGPNMLVVRKAIHLIRNPFDNVVARMHLGLNKMVRTGEMTAERAKRQFPAKTKSGYEQWCRFQDNAMADRLRVTKKIKPKIKRMMKELPCSMEWYKYVLWHNRAFEYTERKRMDMLIVHYESYKTDWSQTVDGIMTFLQLETRGDPVPFESNNKNYGHYYSDQEFVKAKQFVRAVASKRTWRAIRHYFAPSQMVNAAADASSSNQVAVQ